MHRISLLNHIEIRASSNFRTRNEFLFSRVREKNSYKGVIPESFFRNSSLCLHFFEISLGNRQENGAHIVKELAVNFTKPKKLLKSVQ